MESQYKPQAAYCPGILGKIGMAVIGGLAALASTSALPGCSETRIPEQRSCTRDEYSKAEKDIYKFLVDLNKHEIRNHTGEVFHDQSLRFDSLSFLTFPKDGKGRWVYANEGELRAGYFNKDNVIIGKLTDFYGSEKGVVSQKEEIGMINNPFIVEFIKDKSGWKKATAKLIKEKGKFKAIDKKLENASPEEIEKFIIILEKLKEQYRGEN